MNAEYTGGVYPLTIEKSSGTSEEMVDISVVIPCLNEENSIGICVQKAQEALQAAGFYGEVIVADNGSADKSAEIAEKLGARIVVVKERGYGRALQAGIRAAQGKFIIMG